MPGGHRGVSYVFALLMAIAGLAVTALTVRPLAGPFFMFQFAGVVGAALYGGLGPGLFATALCSVGSFAMFFAPDLQQYETYRIVSFVLVSVFFAWVAARVRRAKLDAVEARARAEAAEKEAKRTGEHKDRLVAVVSHDLRNPLNAITMTAEHLQRIMDASEPQARSLSRILTSARRMQSIIHDLLDYARAQHGSGLPVFPRSARLGDVCRSALEDVRAAQPDVRVLLDVTGDDSARFDPGRVEQVVWNLVTNALKHGAAGAPVQVRVLEVPAGVELEVTSQGAPIPPDVVPTLFEPFRAGDGSGNFGLGLFIVHEIVRAHGGTVSVRSGEAGTTFAVSFPKGERPSA